MSTLKYISAPPSVGCGSVLIYSLFAVAPIGCGLLVFVVLVLFCVGSMVCDMIFCVLSSLAIILLRKRESRLLYFNCVVAVCVLCIGFLLAPWVSRQCFLLASGVLSECLLGQGRGASY